MVAPFISTSFPVSTGLRILVFGTVKTPSVAIENFNLTSSQRPQVLSGYLYSCRLVSLRMRPTKGLGLAHRGHRRQAVPHPHFPRLH